MQLGCPLRLSNKSRSLPNKTECIWQKCYWYISVNSAQSFGTCLAWAFLDVHCMWLQKLFFRTNFTPYRGSGRGADPTGFFSSSNWDNLGGFRTPKTKWHLLTGTRYTVVFHWQNRNKHPSILIRVPSLNHINWFSIRQ